jgi:hypothetical protein
MASIRVSEEANYEILSDTPLLLDDYLTGPVRSLHTLLELVIDAPLPMTELVGITPTGKEITILRPQHQPKAVEEVGQPELIPFNLKSLGSDRQAVINRWHEGRETCGPTFDLYFSVKRHANIPVEHQFLFLIQAIETFHRRTISNQAEDPDQHARRIIAILFAVPSQFRKWLCRRLGDYSNEPSLVQRLREVYDLMPATVQSQLGDRKRFARTMADTRNYLTHFNDQLRSRAFTTVGELWGSTQQLGGVLKMLFIRTLGLDPEETLKTVWGIRLLQLLQRASQLQGARLHKAKPVELPTVILPR